METMMRRWCLTMSLLGVVSEGRRTRNYGDPHTDDGEKGEGPVSARSSRESGGA
jgi:hypothetical protein